MTIGSLELVKIVLCKERIMNESQIEKDSKKVISSEQLFQGSREIIIEHCSEKYRLLITKAGKLILNK